MKRVKCTGSDLTDGSHPEEWADTKQIARRKASLYQLYERRDNIESKAGRSQPIRAWIRNEKKQSERHERKGDHIQRSKLIEPYFHALSVGMTLRCKGMVREKDLPYI